MKPLHGLMLLILACSLPVQVVAKSDREQSQAVRDVVHLISTDFAPHQDQIAIQAAGLTEAERQRVYGYIRKDELGPPLLNTIIGFGTGSLISGDTFTGTTVALGELSGLGMLVGTLFIKTNTRYFQPIPIDPAYILDLRLQEGLFIAGIVTFLAFRLYGIFSPLISIPIYNAQLKEILGLETVEIQPYLNTASAGVQVVF